MTQVQVFHYDLQDFMNITFNSFDFSLPLETIELINKLAGEVGSPSYIKTPIFKKKDIKDANILLKKKKRVEDDWELLRTFQTTKIEQKVGINVEIDLIRSYLNKLSEKNFMEMKNKIIELLDKLIEGGIENQDMTKIGENIFEIASNNRFYSKLYADLYSELIIKYEIMNYLFKNSLNRYLELFENIEYVDANVDYDKFCNLNKINENRKSISMFFVNLMLNNIIDPLVVNNLIVSLLKQLYSFIFIDNKKNEVDELVENIAILYKKNIVEPYNTVVVEGMNIIDIIDLLANCKSNKGLFASLKSLSNKSIFKFMDLIEN
jgi:hypothetical protein